MAKFQIDTIADLARQMAFTPSDARLEQLAAAEDLLLSIDAGKGYPVDFIVFRITGYHPKRVTESALLAGSALQHDLGLLVETVSESLDTRSNGLNEPVLAIDDVAEKFNVTSKTIQRWRRRGLPARRFIFNDGRRRVGFRLHCVERFLIAHRDQVSPETKLTLIDDAERHTIVRNARRLVAVGCTEAELVRRIGRTLNRSPLAILHTLRKVDESSAATQKATILAACSAELGEEKRHRILRAHRHGHSLIAIARKFERSRAAVYRVIIDERIARLNRRKVRFIDDELYHGEDAQLAIDEIVRSSRASLTAGSKAAGSISAGPSLSESRMPRDLPPYVADLYRTPLLSPAEEKALFLKFNYHKFCFVDARRMLEPQFARSRDLNGLEKHLRAAVATKNDIVRANLRLVVSVARKHLRSNLSLMELVSDGNLTLMRAVDGFDTHKGYRFSTYATLALMKGFARSVPQMLADVAGARWIRSGGTLPATTSGDPSTIQPTPKARPRREIMADDVADLRTQTIPQSVGARDEVRTLIARLDDRERVVLLAHFGLSSDLLPIRDRTTGDAPITYEQIGQQLKLSTQRIRQIERRALDKLRAIAGKQ